MKYHFHCGHCNQYFECNRDVQKEKVFGICPVCGEPLFLGHGHSLDEVIRDLRLSDREINRTPVTKFVKHGGI